MKFDIFNSFRDRQITKQITKENGKFRVLKSRNVGNNEVKELENYDCYIDDTENLAVAKFLNRDDVVMIPNLTYYPRASFLPKNTITDGSVALLTLKMVADFRQKKIWNITAQKNLKSFIELLVIMVHVH
jgi:DNA (cytosine-5)-methyltransferase 1